MNMYYDPEKRLIIPIPEINEELRDTFIFKYGETVLLWNLLVTAAHSCVQYKNEMSGTPIKALKRSWKIAADRTILLDFATKFRSDLDGKFKILLKKRHDLVHQPIKDMNRLLQEAGVVDSSRPISDEDMRSLIEQQECFKKEVRSYTDTVIDVLESIMAEYKEWKSSTAR